MKGKLLFWIDDDFIFYSLAHSLQKKYEADLYSIVADEQDSSKDFFKTQQLVPFQKVWFFHDNIGIVYKKPDLQYLSLFEEKYGINIWHIAYTDRYFYREFNPYYKFKDYEILSLIEQECRLFENILDEAKPDFMLMAAATTHNTYLLYELCRKKGIKVLALESVRFTNRYMITEEILKHDSLVYYPDTKNDSNIKPHSDVLEQNFDNQIIIRTKISKWEKMRVAFKFLFFPQKNTHQNRYNNLGKTKLKIIFHGATKIRFLKRNYRESFINRNSIREIDDSRPFVYYPMQSEPERITFIGAPFYTNQIAIITNIVKSLPVGYELYVKEHPIMKQFDWRSISYYKQILDLPNVKLVHPEVKAHEIIKRCSLLITIVGSSTLEACFYGKPSIIFMDSDYSILPSVYTLKNLPELPHAIRTSLNKKVNASDLLKYQEFIEKNSFYFDKIKFVTDFSNIFYYVGFLKEVEFPIEKVKQFLEKNKEMFDKLADEYIKKIQMHKRYSSLKQIK